ncbi:uncharacterized protein LOC114844901 isoform X2 [Betta splendens]|uniref:Uncharacterized protein LOC114844901 isoform X2 n=1 Tax=Betta splendens TaxID=158456 RepID=A0A6P7L1G0_BETSP|nr:uncharacterized protein LOC114844901 isoform X2 [Betta splendens]
MEASSLHCLTVLISLFCSTTNQARLTLSSKSSQLFERDALYMKCDDDDGSDEWTVMRNTSKKNMTRCGDDWGRSKNSFCVINNIYPFDSGVYWCESSSASSSSSSSINISVSGGSVILQSPVLPVMEGHDVTLHCQTKSPPSKLPADFYKDGSLIRTEPTGHMTIHRVTKSDEGAYKCSIQACEGPSTTTPPPLFSSCPLCVWWPLKSLFVLVLMLMLVIFLLRQRGSEESKDETRVSELKPSP